MIAGAEVRRALVAAARLAQRDTQALAQFDASVAGFWKSFAAAALILPAHASVYLLARRALDLPLWRELAIGGIAYVISWTAFPLAMAGLCDLIDRRARYILFIVAANWGSVLQTALLVPLALLRLAEVPIAGPLYLAAFLAALAYGWFIARTALAIDGVTAAGLVLFSLLLDLFITGVGDVLLMGSRSESP